MRRRVEALGPRVGGDRGRGARLPSPRDEEEDGMVGHEYRAHILGRRRFNRRQVVKSAAAGATALAAGPLLVRTWGASAEAVTIKILVPQGALADGLIKMAPKFEAETGNKIEVSAFPYTDLQQKTVTLTQVKSNEFDLFFADDPWMPNIKPASSAVALDAEYGYQRDPDVFPVSYDVFSWPPPYGPVPQSVREQNLQTHLYGLPIVGNVILFAIRQDVLESKGLEIPATWDDALAIAKAVYDPNKPFYGWSARQAGGNVDSIPILWSLGGDILDDNFNVVLDNDAGLRTFHLINDLAKFGAPGLVTYDTNEFAADFLAGRAMMGMTWPGDTLVAMEDPAQSQSAGKLHYMNSPAGQAGGKGASVLGNWGLVLNAASTHRDEAYKFMTWITDKKQSLEYAKNGGIPFRQSDLTNPELVAKFPWYPAQAEASAAPPKWRPRTTAGGDILNLYGQAIQRMVGGEQTPEQALKQAADEIRQFMETATD
jgi:multiple sugar transport system substrate-binding protein